MNCPECTKLDIGDYLASTDRLWCEFEAHVFDHTLHTVYYCRRCDWYEQKTFDPQTLHDTMDGEEE